MASFAPGGPGARVTQQGMGPHSAMTLSSLWGDRLLPFWPREWAAEPGESPGVVRVVPRGNSPQAVGQSWAPQDPPPARTVYRASPAGGSVHASLGTSGGTASVARLCGAVSPTPILPVRGPGKHGASDPSPSSRSSPRILAPAPSAPTRTTRALTTSAPSAPRPSPRRGARAAGCGDRPHAPTWEELPAGPPPPPRRPGRASTTWQGTVSKFPSAPPRERHPAPPSGSQPRPRPEAARTCRGTQAGLSEAKTQAPPRRAYRHQKPSANYLRTRTRLPVPCCSLLGHPRPLLWASAAAGPPSLLPSSPPRPPNPASPARSKKRCRTPGR